MKEKVREGGLKRDGQVLDLRQDQVSDEEAQKVIGGLNLSFPAFWLAADIFGYCSLKTTL